MKTYKDMIHIFILTGKGIGKPSAHCVKDICKKYGKIIMGNGEMLCKIIKNIDIIIIAGGQPIVIAEQNLGSKGKNCLRKFTGKFIGICAGAVLATEGKRGHLGLAKGVKCKDDNRQLKTYLDNLQVNINYISPSSNWPKTMYYEGGPILAPIKRKDRKFKTKINVIGLFGLNTTEKMKNQWAIIQVNNVFLFSVHPEFSDDGINIFSDIIRYK